MLTIFLRSVILYAASLLAMRAMGKRQVGQLQPFELVVVIMIAELAATPMGGVGIPILYGLLPMAVAGIDVRRVIDAAIAEMEALDLRSPENPAWQYAAARQLLYGKGYSIELLACYEPSFRFMAEWWKQLYGESEGKDGKGIFPASVEFNADLHSMGQFIQDGPRTLMESVVRFTESRSSLVFPFEEDNADSLNYLAGRKLSEISLVAADAVKEAHITGGVPNIVIEVQRRDEEGFAALVCFFEMACAISGYMSRVNPFNQPGVEEYKKNMFRMLGKPGAK